MKRRAFLRGLAALPVIAVAGAACAEKPKPAVVAGDLHWIPGHGLYRLDWPIGYAVFNQRSMLRLTSVIAV